MSDPRAKRLDEMDDLRDMGCCTLPIYVGATGNALMTILLTYLLRGRRGGPLVLPAWAGGVISANLLPVVVLRSRMDEDTHCPEIGEMDFVGDQHRFSSLLLRGGLGEHARLDRALLEPLSYRHDRASLAGMLSPSSAPFPRRG
jgi:hypothetical protein